MQQEAETEHYLFYHINERRLDESKNCDPICKAKAIESIELCEII